LAYGSEIRFGSNTSSRIDIKVRVYLITKSATSAIRILELNLLTQFKTREFHHSAKDFCVFVEDIDNMGAWENTFTLPVILGIVAMVFVAIGAAALIKIGTSKGP
jgi:hypothetical protein